MDMAVFKSSLAAAEGAAESIRDAFRALGIPEMEVRSIRGSALTHGRPVVSLGIWRLDVIEKVAAAIQLGVAASEAQRAETPEKA